MPWLMFFCLGGGRFRTVIVVFAYNLFRTVARRIIAEIVKEKSQSTTTTTVGAEKEAHHVAMTESEATTTSSSIAEARNYHKTQTDTAV